MISGTPAVPRREVGLRSERGPILLAVMLSVALIAIDATILATAVPSIVGDLGGFSQFPWLFSVYLLAQAVTVPICGKLADSVGRKPLMIFGIVVFLVGSVLCGAAWTMTLLIVARAVQGIGAGAIMPMTMTIMGDIYSVAERGRAQGYLASVWGMASVVGPTLGGIFSEYVSWRWIFFINVPVAGAAMWMLVRRFHETVQRRPHTLDVAGTVLLTLGCSALILALLEGGLAWAWTSPTSLVLFVMGAGCLVLFGLAERRAAEPVVPVWAMSSRVLVGSNLAALAVGALVIGLTSFIPTYAQGVLGHGALAAGFALAAMTVGWPISVSIGGWVYMRIGFRNTALLGGAIVLAGSALTLLLNEGSTLIEIGICCFIIGFGLGWVVSPTLVAVQSVVGWDRRGVVTGINYFARSIGSALGVAVFGAIANSRLDHLFGSAPARLGSHLPSSADDAAVVLDNGSRASDALRVFVRGALADSLHLVFISVACVAVLMLLAVVVMPAKEQPVDVD
jgi:EmrB/QacA subfamily drug resistance transporter